MSAVESKIIRAHGDWLIEEVLREWRLLYFINIMFKPLRGSGSAIDAQMHDAIVNGFYPQLCKRLERHPGRRGTAQISSPFIPVSRFPRVQNPKAIAQTGVVEWRPALQRSSFDFASGSTEGRSRRSYLEKPIVVLWRQD